MRSACRVRSSGRSTWLEYSLPSANGSAERGQQLAPVLLTAARETFQRLEARPWTQRAGNELRATGLTIGQTDLVGPASLTPQQLEIAQLAAEGLTNKEIGERLFLSHRTVGGHLHRAFPKLGVATRAGLRDALASLSREQLPRH
jgi:DNA-binding NarL/FixJ family response regulator